jgi:hypothetical protein
MHDPYVVAFEIRRPWPRISKMRTKQRSFRLPFVRYGQLEFYFPCMVTIWHVEPGGRDSGEVCKHYTRVQDADGKWSYKFHRGWRFHIHHWRIQVGPLQDLRRWALTRCEWCGGRSRGKDQADNSHQWDRERGPWWRGERGLYHRDCSAIHSAHATCLCESPVLDDDTYGLCARCGKRRPFGTRQVALDAKRLLATIPPGRRDADLYERVCAMYAAAPVDAEGNTS